MSMEIVMPKAGLTMVEGTIVEWKAAEGQTVAKGDVLMEYENEKNTVECTALGSGILHITAQEGETVPIGEPIGVLAESQAEYDALVNGAAPAAESEGAPVPAAVSPAAAAPAPVPASPSASVGTSAAGGRVRASGLARKMAAEAGIDLALVPAPRGRVQAADVKAYLESRKSAPAAAPAALSAGDEDEITEIPWTGVKKTIARNMLSSMQTTAQTTCMCEVDVTDFLALRQRLSAEAEKLGCKISVNDLLCKMLGKVMAAHPLANATFDGKTVYSHKHVHLSVAVATEHGLMVPVLRNADTLSLREISIRTRELARQAREKSLPPDAQSGGTTTITNVGMFPIDLATPVINLPQTCICGFGRPKLKPAATPEGTVGLRQIMNVFLTLDHQVIDGMECGRIFEDIQYYLEHPDLIPV